MGEKGRHVNNLPPKAISNFRHLEVIKGLTGFFFIICFSSFVQFKQICILGF